jgi:conserved oligomeric Golgi complex subunit 8
MLSSSLNRTDDSASLRDTLEACIFFATSMGRLGGDFTSMLSTLFEPKMASLVMTHWKEGVATLQETLKVCRDAGVATPLSSSTATSTVATPSPEQPPRQLLTLPPLARLVNSYLTGLNELRRCLLPGIFGVLRKELNRSLSTVKALLETNQRAVNTPGLRGEATQLRELATNMVTMFDKIMEPYVRGALEVALGHYTAAKEFLTKELVDVEDDEENKEDEETEKIAEEEPVEGNQREVEVEAAEVHVPAKTPYETVGETLAAREAKFDVNPTETKPQNMVEGWDDF